MFAADKKDSKENKNEQKTSVAIQAREKRNAAIQAVCQWTPSLTGLVASFASPVDHLYDLMAEEKHNDVEELILTNDQISYLQQRLLPLLHEYNPKANHELKLTEVQINTLKANHLLLAAYFIPHTQWYDFFEAREEFGELGFKKFSIVLKLVLDSKDLNESYSNRSLTDNVKILAYLHSLDECRGLDCIDPRTGCDQYNRLALYISQMISPLLTENLFHVKMTDQDLRNLSIGYWMGSSPCFSPSLKQRFINLVNNDLQITDSAGTEANKIFETWKQFSKKKEYSFFGSNEHTEDSLAICWILNGQTKDDLQERIKIALGRKENPVSASFKAMLSQFVKPHVENKTSSSSCCLVM